MQKERSMLLEVKILVIVNNFYMITCKIVSGYREREREREREIERERAVWMKRHQNIVNGKKLIEITHWLINFNFNLIFTWQILLHINNKFLTVHNKLSKIPPSTSMHLVTCVRRSRVALLLSWSSISFFFGQQDPKEERAIRLVYPLLLRKLRSPFNPRNKALMELGPEILVANEWVHSDNITKFFFSQWPLLSPPDTLTFHPESSFIDQLYAIRPCRRWETTFLVASDIKKL